MTPILCYRDFYEVAVCYYGGGYDAAQAAYDWCYDYDVCRCHPGDDYDEGTVELVKSLREAVADGDADDNMKQVLEVLESLREVE